MKLFLNNNLKNNKRTHICRNADLRQFLGKMQFKTWSVFFFFFLNYLKLMRKQANQTEIRSWANFLWPRALIFIHHKKGRQVADKEACLAGQCEVWLVILT